eukprot:CAMPEP_0181229226 /NCGR_PEP_ID=MMETSP1096-20121128/33776_1 /TAXON_ID=156174 ORGANISM="Chrysochromulina ericina, Strain CCMP281" /NCGR_SAMPLE_ID=MMETSP1096 /ASSEMBLY_ACC=CAM_ASM_000453 /LENGTH=66 /DNA_ID=CAMNT_0023322819 /DNA_START=191 /DNA_END=391 /DNA_ORIENTATION=+
MRQQQTQRSTREGIGAALPQAQRHAPLTIWEQRTRTATQRTCKVTSQNNTNNNDRTRQMIPRGGCD